MSRVRAAIVLLCVIALFFGALETSHGSKTEVVCRDTGSGNGACAESSESEPYASEAGAKNRSGASAEE